MGICLVLVAVNSLSAQEIAKGPEVFAWSELKPLPAPRTSVYAGTVSGMLVVAGGSADHQASGLIWALPKPDGHWQEVGHLPSPRSNGLSITLPEGLLCIGGTNGTEATRDVLLITNRSEEETDKETISWRIESWPALPEPTAFVAGALLEDVIYIYSEKGVWALDLDKEKPSSQRTWERLPKFPGAARRNAIGGAQDGRFLVFGGEAEDGTLLSDGYYYLVAEKRWTRMADLPRAVAAAATPAPALGQAHVAVIGGKPSGNQTLVYHTITDTWAELETDHRFDRQEMPTVYWGEKIRLSWR